MSKTKIVHPKRNPDFVTGAYSDALIVGDFVFVSGQAAVNFETSEFVLGSIEQETELTLHNIKQILEAAGSSLDKVVKSTVHLADINDFDAYNKVYASFFTGVKPTRTTVQSVLFGGLKVEIDVIATLK